jgi:hypothetical protein
MTQFRDDFNKVALLDEAQARELCAKLCAANPEAPRLKKIASVGAYDAVIGGPGVDSRRLTAVMTYLLQSGVMIDPDFEIDIINFRQKRDFLREDTKADLVFVSFILSRHVSGVQTYDRSVPERAEQSADYRFVYGMTLSELHNLEAWRARIEQSGAKIIATYGGKDEIGTHNLRNDGNGHKIKTLIQTPQHSMAYHASAVGGDKNIGGFELETRKDLTFLYNGAANDLPMPWLGFAARADYLRNAACAGPGFSEETALGRTAKHLARSYY